VILSLRTTLRISPSSCSGVKLRPLRPSVGREVDDEVTTRLGFRFRFSGASGITSGSVSSLVDGTRLRFLWRGITQPSPAFSSAYLPKAQSRCDVSNSRPSHYAAIPLITSMERERKSEVQSRRFSQPSYGGADARGVEASNHRADSARQANDSSYR